MISKKTGETSLEDLKTYPQRGVYISVDGKPIDESSWPLILTESTDSSFYMGDYIIDESDGSLREIHFTRYVLNEEGGLNRTPKVE